jgi:hypothetical protein
MVSNKNKLKQWWFNDLSIGVKFVFLALLANALPAIIILMSVPGMTENLFVWTVKPVINARLIGVMYLVVFFAAPYVFVTQEKKHGGRLQKTRISLYEEWAMAAGVSVTAAISEVDMLLQSRQLS